MKPKRPTLRYNVIKIGNVKDKQATLKAARMKQVTYKGNHTRLSADYLETTLQGRRE